MMTLLKRLVAREPRLNVAHLKVQVYTRHECTCCHKALDLLSEYQRQHGFTIEEIDVDSDPALAEEHGLSVPVVAIDGKVRFKGKVNPVLLDRLLLAESRGR